MFTARVAAAFVLALVLCSCRSTRSCEEDANEAYRMCRNPHTAMNYDDQGRPPVPSDEAEACRLAHQHALEQCAGEPVAPVPAIHPDAG